MQLTSSSNCIECVRKGGKLTMCLNPMIRNENGKMWQSAKQFVDGNQHNQEILNFKLQSGQWQLIPCNQCIQCRCQYADRWAGRCMNELEYHKNSHYLTLTYADDELPVMDIETGEFYRGLKDPDKYKEKLLKSNEKGILYHKDFQDFMKRLRIYVQRHNLGEEEPIKFFMCGEYGGKNGRPHFHAIIYGFEIPDLKVKFRRNGYEYDVSEMMENLWQHGNVTIGKVEHQSCRYVARYMMKKHKGKEETEAMKKAGLPLEYNCMSRKPGIGMQYWKDHREEIYANDQIILANGKSIKPPKFYDMLEDEYLQEKEEFEEPEYDCENKNSKFKSQEMQELSRKRRKAANDKLIADLKAQNRTIDKLYEEREKALKSRSKLGCKREGV